MQKVLVTVILALFMALAVVGIRNTVLSATSNQRTVLTAEGGSPLPPPNDSF